MDDKRDFCATEANKGLLEHARSNFITRNDGFVCDACGKHVPPAQKTCRNHCTACLASKHVDGSTPGDRTSSCHGIMPTISVEGSDPDTVDLVQTCLLCGHTRKNKIAQDDNRDTLFSIIQKQ